MKSLVLSLGLLLISACDVSIEVPAATEFALPPVLMPSSTAHSSGEGEVKTFELVLQHGQTEFLPGAPASTMGINGDFLGPVIVVQRGDRVTLNVKNTIGETSTIHWHGLHIPPEMDGGPHQQIGSGKTWSPNFTIDNRAGLYWFHPHLEGVTGRQVYQGLAGLMVIQDPEESALDLPRNYGVDDFPLVIQDRRIDEDGQLMYMNAIVDHAGMRGKNILVNGRKTPPLRVPAQRIRFRILNGSNARFYQLGFSDGRSFKVIASDGGLLAKPVARTRLEIGSGERYELVVDLSDAEGKDIQLMSYSSELGLDSMDFDDLDASDFLIMNLIVTERGDAPAGPVPSSLSAIPAPSLDPPDNSRTLTFGMAPGGVMTINGKTMAMDRIDEVVYLGDTEVWTLRNTSDVPHPIHIHDVQFRVLSRNDAPPADYEAGWKDTVIVHPSESVRVQMTFEDFANPDIPYMYHCHILEHEDRGMMGQFLVKER